MILLIQVKGGIAIGSLKNELSLNLKGVLLLRLFSEVVNLNGKNFTYRLDQTAEVPNNSLMLWRDRGFDPSSYGVAFVKFTDNKKEYTYPAYFWSE